MGGSRSCSAACCRVQYCSSKILVVACQASLQRQLDTKDVNLRTDFAAGSYTIVEVELEEYSTLNLSVYFSFVII